jgi:hypothetical protein
MNQTFSSEPQPSAAPAVSPAVMQRMEQQYNLTRQFTSGANWFYWIAGLSVINTVIMLSGGSMSFVAGLGLTQLVDSVVLMLVQDATAEVALILRVINLVIDLGAVALFVFFGFFARKGHRWAFVVGMVFYFFDALIFLLGPDYFGLAFHALALWFLWGGLKAIGALKMLEQENSVITPV